MTLRMYRDGDLFPPLAGPIITYEQLRREELEHPERFASEYRGHFSNVVNGYLKPVHIARCFERWNGAPLTMQTIGHPDVEYYAHCDPSRSGANFALVIAHAEHNEGPDPDVVVDLIKVWRPRDFRDGEINYVQVENELFEYIQAFALRGLSFDQWNSAGTIDHLRERLRQAQFWWRTDITERTATHASNWGEAENFNTGLHKNLVHLPYLELTEQELLSLEWDGHQKVHPPATGPCTTSDTTDCLFALTHHLLDARFDPRTFSEVRLRPKYPGGIAPSIGDRGIFDEIANFGPNHSPHAAGHQKMWRPGRGPRRGRGFGTQ
jgi:hypothetical protein